MASAVLDASALLAYLNSEPGSETVAAVIGDAVISAVNFAEAVTKLVERGGSIQAARAALGVAPVDVIAFTQPLAEEAGALVSRTRSKGLSLGDRACLALAAQEALPALTADHMWEGLNVGVVVRLIR